jgi:hypothetical protein
MYSHLWYGDLCQTINMAHRCDVFLIGKHYKKLVAVSKRKT